MRKSFIIGYIGYFIVILLVSIGCAGFRFVNHYFDIPTLVYLLLTIILSLLLTNSFGDFKNCIRLGLRKQYSCSMLELKRAESVLHMLTKVFILFAVLYALFNQIALLYNMSDPSALGPALSLTLVGILYACCGLLFLLPLKATVRLSMIAYGLDSTGIETANAQDNAQTAYYLLRSKGLTDRETEVTRLCCQSMTNKEIATQLYISEATVKKHMTHILEKLGLERREQLAEYLTELISPQS